MQAARRKPAKAPDGAADPAEGLQGVHGIQRPQDFRKTSSAGIGIYFVEPDRPVFRRPDGTPYDPSPFNVRQYEEEYGPGGVPEGYSMAAITPLQSQARSPGLPSPWWPFRGSCSIWHLLPQDQRQTCPCIPPSWAPWDWSPPRGHSSWPADVDAGCGRGTRPRKPGRSDVTDCAVPVPKSKLDE